MRPSLAIDFDGTITADAKFPIIGEENLWVVGNTMDLGGEWEIDFDLWTQQEDGIHYVSPNGIIKAPATYVIKKLSSNFEIIMHTCRTNEAQKMMEEWLSTKAHTKMHRGHDYYINNNPHCPEAHEKPFADVYLDNRGLTWHQELNVEEAIHNLIKNLPVHEYIPQKGAE